ncbi:MAG: hypothetical protein ACE5E7_13175 [Anaerolineae bacterium]
MGFASRSSEFIRSFSKATHIRGRYPASKAGAWGRADGVVSLLFVGLSGQAPLSVESYAADLSLTVLFVLSFYGLLVLWEKRQGKYSFEWWLRKWST